MTTTHPTRLRPEIVRRLTDAQLERELTHTAIRSHRRFRFELLLAERRRRSACRTA